MANRPSILVTIGLLLAVGLSGCLGNGGLGDSGTATTGGTDGDDPDGPGDGNQTGDDTTTDTGDGSTPSDGGTTTSTGDGNTTSGNETTGDNTTVGNTTTFQWGDQAQATVRPGVQVAVGSSICTSNFLYRSPQNGTYYLGIAAHCVYDTLGEEVFLSSAIGVLGSQGERIGRVVYSSYEELGIQDDGTAIHPHENDLALVQLDQSVLPKTHPSMKHFGGPVSNVTALTELGLGSKLLVHGDTPMRPGPDEADRLEGYVTGTTAPWTVHAYFAPYSFQGDSGSAVITGDGKAVGVLVSLATLPPGETGISFLPPMLTFAADKGFPVEVVTWGQFDNGTLP